MYIYHIKSDLRKDFFGVEWRDSRGRDAQGIGKTGGMASLLGWVTGRGTRRMYSKETVPHSKSMVEN